MMAPGAMPEAGQLAMVACRTSWHLSNLAINYGDGLDNHGGL